MELCRGQSEELASYALGLCVIAAKLPEGHLDAGKRYATLHRLVYGSGTPRAAQMSEPAGGDVPEAALEKATAALSRGRQAVCALSRQHLTMLENVCVYDRAPRWVLPSHVGGPRTLREMLRLRDALDALCRGWGM